MRKMRADYKEGRNKRIAVAKLEGGLSYGDIQKNPNFNPDGLTVQRIQQIVKYYQRLLEKENNNAKA